MVKTTHGHHHWCKKILYGWGRVIGDWTDLLFFQILSYRKVWNINLYVLCKKNSRVTKQIPNGQHPWNQEYYPWIRKGSWEMTRSTSVNFWATYKLNINFYVLFNINLKVSSTLIILGVSKTSNSIFYQCKFWLGHDQLLRLPLVICKKSNIYIFFFLIKTINMFYFCLVRKYLIYLLYVL